MLQIHNLSFSYNKAVVLKKINIKVKPGENVAIIGESGSGKSTLLSLIYGDYNLEKGSIIWKETRILGPAFNLVIGYDFMKRVTQEFDLMPFISVEENIGKFLSNFFPEEKQNRIAELIEIVELQEFAKTKVTYLSGGQKQRVALATALAKEPEILLLDEPFSHIDNFKKRSLRRNLFKYLKEKNITCVIATHDKDDVLSYSDIVVVLHQGEIIAKDTPEHLYNNPETPLIASFFGEFNNIPPFGIAYAQQLKVCETSDIKVLVIRSYFNGGNYLIEGKLSGKPIFFTHANAIIEGDIVNLIAIK